MLLGMGLGESWSHYFSSCISARFVPSRWFRYGFGSGAGPFFMLLACWWHQWVVQRQGLSGGSQWLSNGGGSAWQHRWQWFAETVDGAAAAVVVRSSWRDDFSMAVALTGRIFVGEWLLAVPDCAWWLLGAPGGRLLTAPGSSWLLLAVPGGSWRLLAALRQYTYSICGSFSYLITVSVSIITGPLPLLHHKLLLPSQSVFH